MTSEAIMDMGYNAIKVGLMISLPLLLTALFTGLLVSIFQAATQINEMTLSFIPKILMIVLVAVFLGPNMLETVLDYMTELYASIPDATR